MAPSDDNQKTKRQLIQELTTLRAEKAALEPPDKVAQRERLEAQLFANVSHEVRSPLAPISNAVQILKHLDTADINVRRAREIIERQVNHLGRLAEDLLDVSHVIDGKLTLRRDRVDLARLVRLTAEDQRGAVEQARLTLALEVPETPVWVSGDAVRLAQIAARLLDHAIQFTDAGGTVNVRLTSRHDEGQTVLRLADTGIGIEPAQLPRLFDIFPQAERSPDRARRGLGLGLALVKGLVDLHGGTIQVASEGPGRGSEFTLCLPQLTEEPALLAAPMTPRPGTKRLRVLVVEDNRDSAESLRMFLELVGYEVAVAYSGTDGLQTALQTRPDAVVCDIGLPGMDGFAVARALRKNPTTAKARLIAVTGYGQEEDRQRALQAGFDQHMTKPVDPEKLLGQLNPV
jgi:CheY-like chemotaxis protein/nitrogen-specific signal transduction histidine kinase